ncbi:MAG TPA: hypothetical protein PKJ26_03525 [Candidatus Woesebacteria bacterium]|nr:hypothetical protein [Candidatus Woesebacteria bacterium]HNS65540.1 hypothetical protein [Candidatus Woesebacteria bacterium]
MLLVAQFILQFLPLFWRPIILNFDAGSVTLDGFVFASLLTFLVAVACFEACIETIVTRYGTGLVIDVPVTAALFKVIIQVPVAAVLAQSVAVIRLSNAPVMTVLIVRATVIPASVEVVRARLVAVQDAIFPVSRDYSKVILDVHSSKM